LFFDYMFSLQKDLSSFQYSFFNNVFHMVAHQSSWKAKSPFEFDMNLN
jgi:hypothetical protein